MTLQEFKVKYLGKQVEYHSFGAGALYQCVDLINAYINQCLDNNTKDYTEIIGANAKDFKTKFDPQDFDWIDNTPPGVPQTGDIMVWNGKAGGGVGHVAIFLEGDASTFRSLDQNWSQVERVTLENHTYTNVSGWLKPKNQVQAVDSSEFERVKKLLKDNEETNKQKDELIKNLNTEITEVKKQRDESDKAIITLNGKIEALNTAMGQDAVNDKDILLHAKELEEQRDIANGELAGIASKLDLPTYEYKAVLGAIESLQKPKEEIIKYYEPILNEFFKNLVKGKKTKPLIEKLKSYLTRYFDGR